MLFSSRSPMKRLLARAAALLTACALACCARPPRPRREGHALPPPRRAIPATLDPITTTEEHGILVEEMIFRPLARARRRRTARAGARALLDGLSRRARLRVPSRPEGGVGGRLAGDVRRRALHDRADSRSEGPGGQLSRARSRTSPPSRRRTPRRCSSGSRRPYAERLLAFNLPIVSAAAYAPREVGRGLDRHPGRERAVPAGAVEHEPVDRARPPRRTCPAAARPFRRVVFRIIPDNDRALPGRARAASSTSSASAATSVPRPSARRSSSRGTGCSRCRSRSRRTCLWNCRNPFLADSRVRRALGARLAARGDGPAALPAGRSVARVRPLPRRAPPRTLRRSGRPRTTRRSPAPARRSGLADGAGRVPAARRTQGVVRVPLSRRGRPIYSALAEILRELLPEGRRRARAAAARLGRVLASGPTRGSSTSQLDGARVSAAELRSLPALPLEPDPAPRPEHRLLPEPGGRPRDGRGATRDRTARKRLELYRQIHRLLAADPPADFLWGADQYWGISRQVEGVEVSPARPLPLSAGSARLAAGRRADSDRLADREDRLHRDPRRRQDDALFRARRSVEEEGQGRRDGARGRAILPPADQPRHDGRGAILDPAHRDRRGAGGRGQGRDRHLRPKRSRQLLLSASDRQSIRCSSRSSSGGRRPTSS